MINNGPNRVAITPEDKTPDAGSVLCRITAATEHVAISGTQWLLEADIRFYNDNLDRLKGKRDVTLRLRGEYVGAFELTIAPFTSNGTYKVTLSCEFDRNGPHHDFSPYAAKDEFLIDGEFVNESFKAIAL